jgi:membrane-bound lytic murein transglycosylase D
MNFSDYPMHLSRFLLPFTLTFLVGCSVLQQKTGTESSKLRYLAKDTSRTIDLTQPPADAWERIRRGFAIPNLHTDLSAQWTKYYASRPEAVQRMAERASKYLYFIVEEINRRGLPTELALLPFIESAYNPTALSSAKASGLWQFIPSTGQHFKLKQNAWQDERRDPIASTYAALDYLEKLFEMQGDWYLALASYNWGEGSVQRAMAKKKATGQPSDYLSLKMPEETRNYVPKLQAIKNIIADPQRYALALPAVDNTPYFSTIRKRRDIDLAVAARLAEMPLEEFKALNPSFKRAVIRGNDEPTLLLPTDRVEIFNANLSNFKGELSSLTVYNPRRGESYAAIAKRFGIPETTLRQINGVNARQAVVAGQVLIVPGQAKRSPERLAALSAAKPKERAHKVRSGDTLVLLAKQYGTTVDALRALNKLGNNRLKVGAQLLLPDIDASG